MKMFVIESITEADKGLFWSNKDGWVESLFDATKFSNTGFRLPIGGKWKILV